MPAAILVVVGYGGTDVVDVVEKSRDRTAKEIFGAKFQRSTIQEVRAN